jgi:predicted outer membrane protein
MRKAGKVGKVGTTGRLSTWRVAAAAGLVFAAVGAARAADTPYDPRGGRDQEIVTQLHQQNQDAIAAARIAQERATRADVKSFAEKVVSDREAVDARLLAYAEREGMNIPEIRTAAGALPHGPLATARLATSAPDRFDVEFANAMVAREQANVDQAVQAETLARGPRLARVIRDLIPKLVGEQADAMALAAAVPTLPPPAVQQPGDPSGASWTHTGADTRP